MLRTHPIEYPRLRRGVIPPRGVRRGDVIVWDRGSYLGSHATMTRAARHRRGRVSTRPGRGQLLAVILADRRVHTRTHGCSCTIITSTRGFFKVGVRRTHRNPRPQRGTPTTRSRMRSRRVLRSDLPPSERRCGAPLTRGALRGQDSPAPVPALTSAPPWTPSFRRHLGGVRPQPALTNLTSPCSPPARTRRP